MASGSEIPAKGTLLEGVVRGSGEELEQFIAAGIKASTEVDGRNATDEFIHRAIYGYIFDPKAAESMHKKGIADLRSPVSISLQKAMGRKAGLLHLLLKEAGIRDAPRDVDPRAALDSTESGLATRIVEFSRITRTRYHAAKLFTKACAAGLTSTVNDVLTQLTEEERKALFFEGERLIVVQRSDGRHFQSFSMKRAFRMALENNHISLSKRLLECAFIKKVALEKVLPTVHEVQTNAALQFVLASYDECEVKEDFPESAVKFMGNTTFSWVVKEVARRAKEMPMQHFKTVLQSAVIANNLELVQELIKTGDSEGGGEGRARLRLASIEPIERVAIAIDAAREASEFESLSLLVQTEGFFDGVPSQKIKQLFFQSVQSGFSEFVDSILAHRDLLTRFVTPATVGALLSRITHEKKDRSLLPLLLSNEYLRNILLRRENRTLAQKHLLKKGDYDLLLEIAPCPEPGSAAHIHLVESFFQAAAETQNTTHMRFVIDRYRFDAIDPEIQRRCHMLAFKCAIESHNTSFLAAHVNSPEYAPFVDSVTAPSLLQLAFKSEDSALLDALFVHPYCQEELSDPDSMLWVDAALIGKHSDRIIQLITHPSTPLTNTRDYTDLFAGLALTGEFALASALLCNPDLAETKSLFLDPENLCNMIEYLHDRDKDESIEKIFSHFPGSEGSIDWIGRAYPFIV